MHGQQSDVAYAISNVGNLPNNPAEMHHYSVVKACQYCSHMRGPYQVLMALGGRCCMIN